MKKTLSFILIISLLATITGCSVVNEKQDKLKIVTTIFPYYSFAKEIFGEDAEITMLLKPGAESHTYDPTTQDIIAIKKADVFIYTGGETDAWVDTILSSIDTNKTKLVKAIDNINKIDDEHIWTSIKNAILITEDIYNTVNNVKYLDNKDNFTNKLGTLDSEFEDIINSNRKTFVFADRFPFSYFARDYGLDYISAFPSCSEESEPSVQTMADIINTVKQQDINTVFYIEFSNQKIADTIKRETGVNTLLFHSCHNVSAEDFNSGVTYYNLMKQNLKNLKEAAK